MYLNMESKQCKIEKERLWGRASLRHWKANLNEVVRLATASPAITNDGDSVPLGVYLLGADFFAELSILSIN